MTVFVSSELITQSKKFCMAALLLTTTMLATGCASTATGAKQSAMVGLAKAETLKTQMPEGGVMAVIRYPAVVETNAKDAYYKAFESSAIGGTVSGGDAAERQSIADSVIVKSNYFALSLYKEMAARLPDHAILLSPHAVKLGADGKLTSEPITQAESFARRFICQCPTYPLCSRKWPQRCIRCHGKNAARPI